MPSKSYLMLRSARRARLEARTGLLQLFFLSAARFSNNLESGNRGAEIRAPALDPRFRGVTTSVW